MINTIIISIIFAFLYAINYLFKKDRQHDFKKNHHLYKKLAKNVSQLLGDNLVKYIRTGSTACGISIGSSDIDIGIFVNDVGAALETLIDNGFIITQKYGHFINLTKAKNPLTANLDCDVKIYFQEEELDRLDEAIKKYTDTVSACTRYWIISQKFWYNLTNQSGTYDIIKKAYYRKYHILK